MMRLLDWNALDETGRRAALARPPLSRTSSLRKDVADIIAGVRARGDSALREFGARFDGCALDDFEVAEGEFAAAEASLAPALKSAIREAASRIEIFHRACMSEAVCVETAPGVRVRQIARAIVRVGLYVPAGSAPLPSTALMLCLPARLAGCTEILLCSPPRKDGSCDPAVLYAARLAGASRVFKLGGAHAIAAMAYGTESLPKCDKLFGPGNAWVTEAKLQVSSEPDGTAIDMPAGPSEVLVIGDAQADSAFVAADLLSQAEHGADSQAILLGDSLAFLESVQAEVERQYALLPRASIARQSLSTSRAIRVDSIAQAIEVSNRYAPEHLILHVARPSDWLARIESAGSVFLGAWTPESLGDYCSGSNHVLPTYGWARSCSGVSVASFQKKITVQECTAQGLRVIGPCAAALAAAEKLDAHARAVTLRLTALKQREAQPA